MSVSEVGFSDTRSRVPCGDIAANTRDVAMPRGGHRNRQLARRSARHCTEARRGDSAEAWSAMLAGGCGGHVDDGADGGLVQG